MPAVGTTPPAYIKAAASGSRDCPLVGPPDPPLTERKRAGHTGPGSFFALRSATIFVTAKQPSNHYAALPMTSPPTMAAKPSCSEEAMSSTASTLTGSIRSYCKEQFSARMVPPASVCQLWFWTWQYSM